MATRAPQMMPVLSDDFETLTCRREKTVRDFLEQLRTSRVILVRGTPSSGKSTLSRLLELYARNSDPDLTVHRIVWNVSRPDYINHFRALNALTGRAERDHDDWFRQRQILLIVDEAQASYSFPDFWAELVKPVAQAHKGPMIALFASYGSSATGPSDGGITPMTFSDDQQISARPRPYSDTGLVLYFTRSEFDDVVSRYSAHTGHYGQPFLLEPDLTTYIWEFINGYPGAVDAVLEILAKSAIIRPFRKASAQVSLHTALDVIDAENEFFSKLSQSGFSRSLIPKQAVKNQVDLATFLQTLLVTDCSKDNPDSNKSLHDCYNRGWLQAELVPDEDGDNETVYVFPSRLHRAWVESILRKSSPIFPSRTFPSLRQLCAAVIRNFRYLSLGSQEMRIGAGAVTRPPEARYQDEFYRACHETLGGHIYLTSEWSPAGRKGRVDFRLKSQKWAIKCVREGDRLRNHVDRFMPEGVFFDWIRLGHIEDHLLIDFRTTPIPENMGDVPFLVFAVFSDGFRSCKLFDSNGKLEDEFSLLG
ncbi:MAG: hypothetical protein M4579_007189 [Chaenotheca gracillima]|nr:MAG: hypothetical protein M4579_007189 [Chaenotheca gracillima]